MNKVDEYYKLINKLAVAGGASELRLNFKDEKMHLKTMRTFFFLQAIVSSYLFVLIQLCTLII